MANLQAVLDFSVELHKFINVDLFQRGYYQVRITHKVSSKIKHKIEVNYSRLGKDASGSSGSSSGRNSSSLGRFGGNIVFPPCIVNGAAVSKTFQILYKSEEVELNDVLCFKTHLVLDASRCIDQVRRVQFMLDVELWYTDQEFGPEHHSSIECVSSRQLLLHVDLCRGIHCHIPVIFDYFHLSAVTVSIHAALVTLCQPYLTHRVRARSAWSSEPDVQNDISGYDSLLYGCTLMVLKDLEKEEIEMRSRRAELVHWQLCSLIFTSLQSLERKIDEYRSLPSRHHRHSHHQSRHHHSKTEVKPSPKSMSSLAQACYKSFTDGAKDKNKDFIAHQNCNHSAPGIQPADYITLVESDLAYLSGLSILQWEQFLKLVVHSDRIAHHLAKVHHNQRIKRFAEGFFVIEKPRSSIISICDQSSIIFTEICDALRKSEYFRCLPACDVECLSLDGDATTLPVIFEEKYEPHSPNHPGLEESLANLLSVHHHQHHPPPMPSKSLKEKLMTRLALTYSPVRASASGRNSASFCERTSDQKKRYVQESLCSSRSRSQTRSSLRSTVTMTDLKALNRTDNALCAAAAPLLIAPVQSAGVEKVHRSSTKMSYSESLPDLSVLTSFAKFMSMQPTNRTTDNNVKSKKSTSGNNKDLCSWESETFEGTTYFPKPPPQFGECISDNDTNGKVRSTPTSVTIEAETNSSSLNDSLSTSSVNMQKESVDPVIPSGPASKLCSKCSSSDNCKCHASSEPLSRDHGHEQERTRKISTVSSVLLSFLEAKESFRNEKMKGWNFYSDFARLASKIPYFQSDEDLKSFTLSATRDQHLIICVHGLDGNSADLRLIKTYLELGLPTSNFEFLMSQRNQGETFECLETLSDRLVNEILYHIEVFRLNPSKISFIGHSLGNVIIRGALSQPLMKPWLTKLHTFLSLSGPHLGTAYNSSGLVNMGLWVFQKWKKSASLLQLTMKDHVDPRCCYLYKLSQEPGLEFFKNVILCGSSQDNYVPVHSAHIELCSAALSDTSLYGYAYREMVNNLLQPVMNNNCKLVRYDVHHALNSNANALIGRAAHIAVLDSELFIEKFMVVCGLKYFV